MKSEQAAGCYNLRGVSKKFYKKQRNRAQRRIKFEIPDKCIRGWAD